jgi:biopolymer transport protein ExbD
MAEINSNTDSSKQKGRQRTSKVSTKIDMTPMVDLAFLLITFFMLTTTFNKLPAMEVNMPDREQNMHMPISASRTLTFILGKNNQVYWYQGDNKIESMQIAKVDFSNSLQVRKILVEQSTKILAKTNKDAIILIKSLDNAKYGNLINLLDELHITNQKIYAIVDVYDVEKQVLVKQFGV